MCLCSYTHTHTCIHVEKRLRRHVCRMDHAFVMDGCVYVTYLGADEEADVGGDAAHAALHEGQNLVKCMYVDMVVCVSRRGRTCVG